MRRGRSRATGREAVAFRPRRQVVGREVMLAVLLGTVAAGGTPGVGALVVSFTGVPVISCCRERAVVVALGVRVLVA